MPRSAKHCRLPAYRLFAEQIQKLETTDGLLNSAIAVSMHEQVNATPLEVTQSLDALASRVLARIRSQSTAARLAHLHAVLFDEEGFSGNSDDYYNPRNSYVPAILETRRGLPVTLSLVYKSVAERVGLCVRGVNAPGHFVCRVESHAAPMIVDAFDQGRVLNASEMVERVAQATGHTSWSVDSVLQVATHRQWLARIIHNLEAVFTRGGQMENLAAMQELQGLLRATAE